MPIKGIQYQTSVKTGTRGKTSDGVALANLMIGSMNVANKINKADEDEKNKARIETERARIKTKQEESDLRQVEFLQFEDIKATNEEQRVTDGYYSLTDDSKKMQYLYDQRQQTSKDYNPIDAKMDISKRNYLSVIDKNINKLAASENKKAQKDLYSRALENTTSASTMEDVDTLLETVNSFDGGDTYTKQKFLVNYAEKVNDTLIENGANGYTREEVLADFPLALDSKDEKATKKFESTVNKIIKANKQKKYGNELSNAVTSGEPINYKALSKLGKDNDKTVIQTKKDIDKLAEEMANALSVSDDPIQLQKSVNMSNESDVKITKVESSLKNMRMSAITNPEGAFESYQYVQKMLSSGYVPTEKLDYIKTIESMAQAVGFKIDSPVAFASASNYYETAKTKQFDPMTRNEILEHDSLKDNWGYDDQIANKEQKEFIVKKAMTLSMMMPQEEAISLAIQLSDTSVKTQDGFGTDFSGAREVRTIEDVNVLKESLIRKSGGNVDDLSIHSVGDAFVLRFQYKDGTSVEEPRTAGQINQMVIDQKKIEFNREGRLELLKNKTKLREKLDKVKDRAEHRDKIKKYGSTYWIESLKDIMSEIPNTTNLGTALGSFGVKSISDITKEDLTEIGNKMREYGLVPQDKFKEWYSDLSNDNIDYDKLLESLPLEDLEEIQNIK